jgi:glutamate decarboxylase
MPLHHRSDIPASSADTVFSHLDHEVPKYRFPEPESDPARSLQFVSDELYLDGNARQNLATFCQTWVEPEVRVLMDLAMDKNLIDKDEYPQSAEIERRCVHMLADLWNAPTDGDPTGTSGIGSSEACMLAGMAMHRRWKARRVASGASTDRPNLVCGPVQVVWHKFARYWDIELREVGMAPGRLHLDPASMLEQVDEHTIGVVATLGVTFTGAYEPVAELAAALDDLQGRTGWDVDLHVDAASGGFTAPFCAPELAWDFRVPRVKSISASGHKFGLAPLGAGWVLWRDRAELPDELIFHVTYLGGDMPVFQLNFSRPAGQVIAQYYEFVRLGREGYAKVHGASYRVARHLAEALRGIEQFALLFDGDPQEGIPTVTWTLRADAGVSWTLFDLADRLRVRGWQVPAYPLTGELSSTVVQRALIRQDISYDQVELLIEDIRAAIDHLGRHPVSVPLVQPEAGGFHH